jgi:tRNA(Ile)-lysidine synthase TilS/MesJ
MTIRCKKCYISSRVPNIALDSTGICNLCHSYDSKESTKKKESALNEMFEMFNDVKSTSKDKAAYDCILALSGGKDSTYILKYLVEERGLRVLAITIDNGFLSELSIQNSRLICDHLNNDFILFRPKIRHMAQLYKNGLDGNNHSKSIIKRASDICNNCINLINSIMLKEALSRNIRLIVGGYISGQVPRNGSIMRLHVNMIREFSENRSRLGADPSYNPTISDFSRYTHGDSITVCNPYLAIEYDEKKIFTTLQSLGWKRPLDTGAHSSNCQLNDLGIVNHQMKYGFHPYEYEISEQVRAGSLSYIEAKNKIDEKIDEKKIILIKNKLDLI